MGRQKLSNKCYVFKVIITVNDLNFFCHSSDADVSLTALSSGPSGTSKV